MAELPVIPAPLAALRREYALSRLDEADVDPNPLRQFEVWLQQALVARVVEPNAMTLATATHDGRPSARYVLLKGLDERGFVFFTNYESQKAADLTANPYAALVLHWAELERQVRVAGPVTEVSGEEATAYFHSRPRGAQLAAWASPQSRVLLGGRAELEACLAAVQTRFGDGPIPRPPFWGGYRVAPETMEFWQGRPDRMHDRLRYSRASTAETTWRLDRLAP